MNVDHRPHIPRLQTVTGHIARQHDAVVLFDHDATEGQAVSRVMDPRLMHPSMRFDDSPGQPAVAAASKRGRRPKADRPAVLGLLYLHPCRAAALDERRPMTSAAPSRFPNREGDGDHAGAAVPAWTSLQDRYQFDSDTRS